MQKNMLWFKVNFVLVNILSQLISIHTVLDFLELGVFGSVITCGIWEDPNLWCQHNFISCNLEKLLNDDIIDILAGF